MGDPAERGVKHPPDHTRVRATVCRLTESQVLNTTYLTLLPSDPDLYMPRSLGITSLQILGAIRDGNAYGLEIVTRTGLASGTVYPTLGRLKKSGLVKPSWEDQRTAERDGRPRRRYYELTADGARTLTEGVARLANVAANLTASPASGA